MFDRFYSSPFKDDSEQLYGERTITNYSGPLNSGRLNLGMQNLGCRGLTINYTWIFKVGFGAPNPCVVLGVNCIHFLIDGKN